MTIEDLEKVKRAVIRKYGILSNLALNNIDVELDENIPTACVEAERNQVGKLCAKKIKFNPSFMDSLSFSERVFVFAHEISHIALRHFSRAMNKPEKDAKKKFDEYCKTETNSQKRKIMEQIIYSRYHKMWNIATDACINAFLRRDGLKFPEGIIDPKTGEKMKFVDLPEGLYQNAEKIYDHLVKKQEEKEQQEKQEQNDNNKNQSGNDSNDNSQSSNYNSQSSNNLNNNDISDKDNQNNSNEDKSSDKTNDMNNNSKSDNNNTYNNNSKTNSNSDQTDYGELDEIDIDNYQGFDSHEEWSGEKNNDSKDKIDEQKDFDNIDEDYENIDEEEIFNKELSNKENKDNPSTKEILSKLRGRQGLDNYVPVKPIIPWQSLLVGMLEKTEEIWGNRRASKFNPNPRIEERTYETLPSVEVMLDVSGSISESLLKGFLLQLYPIFEVVEGEEDATIKVGCFDHEFYGFETISSRKDIANFKPPGGGRTDFQLAVDSFTYDPGHQTTKIIFTDGECSAPDTNLFEIIWIVFNNTSYKPKTGRVIRINDEEYRKMIETGLLMVDDIEPKVTKYIKRW